MPTRRLITLFAATSLTASAALADVRTGVFPEPLPDRYRTQARFTAALAEPIAATWKGVTLRTIVRRISLDRQICLLLDRRVDPEQVIRIDTGERPLLSAVDEIARFANLSVTPVGNCLMLAPPAAAARLRTLVALRETSLREARGANRARTLRATIVWKDLDRPAEILSEIARQFGLSIDGSEKIPHDMWAGGAIPDATAAEALSIVLNQFDLTFEWTSGGAGARLLPIPPAVAIERTYFLHGRPANETLRTLRSKIDGLDAEVKGGRLVVRGTVEQHEAVAQALGLARPHSRTPLGKSALANSAPPLERQSFRLEAKGVGLRDLIDELRKQGVEIQYNEAELKKAGIDLDAKRSVNLPNLPAQQFFERLFAPSGIRFRIDRGVVVLQPR